MSKKGSNVAGWTEARYWSFIRSALRRAWTKYPPKFQALNAAKRRKLNAKGNQKYEYKCASCGGFFAGKNVSVDHIVPAGSLRSFSDLPDFCSRLFCKLEDLQVLCFRCHKEKTNLERGINPLVVEFKKGNAAYQKAKLRELQLPEGKNFKERVKIFEEHINGTKI